MILTAPSIWRPQSLIEWFTEGKAQRDPTSGKIKRKSANGKAVRNSATNSNCCCGTPVSPCSVCPTTPSTVTAFVSGITTCACLFVGGGNYHGFTGNPNGTFTLTQNAISPCCYEYTYSLGVCSFVDYGTDSTCTTPFATYQVYIFACYSSLGGGSLYVESTINRSPGDTSYQIFRTSETSGIGVSIANCLTTGTVTNAITVCAAATELGHGGSIDLTGNP